MQKAGFPAPPAKTLIMLAGVRGADADILTAKCSRALVSRFSSGPEPSGKKPVPSATRRPVRIPVAAGVPAGRIFTICAKNRECLFGQIVDTTIRVNQSGELIQRIWDELPNRHTNLDLDAFILMPYHLHGIIVLTDNAAVGADHVSARICAHT